MFIRKPRILRLTASWLLVQTLSQLAWPTVSYALTSGPTVPEATNFEPVDTTDMVNLNSGDLTYNIPLLEVPGPEGGYPLALSYHAGIQPNEDASWVGLGWSLNPGAISRNVNGYADDHQNVQQVNRDYWEGGNTTTTSAGVTLGIAGSPASVSFGLSFSQDTYKGFGQGTSMGIGVGIANTPVSVGVSVSDDGYGGHSAGLNLSGGKAIGGTTAGAVSLGGSIGVSTNFNNVSVNGGAGVSIHGASLLGASISSQNGKPSFTVGGGSVGIHNDKAGIIQTESSNFGLSIPVYAGVWVSYAYNYTRYWSDEVSSAYTSGALYNPTTYGTTGYYEDHAFDMYRLPDPYNEDFVANPDPDLIQGGSFADYDNYYVTAQGLSGSMRPYSYQQALVGRTRKQTDNSVLEKSRDINFTNKKLNFRFANDFSNQYRQTPGNNWNTNSYPFDANPVYGKGDGTYGYDAASNRLIGSKHIEWFTNLDISNGTAAAKGFIDTSSPGFSRSATVQTDESKMQIGGFMITNESGVTYHYALPAYSFNEHVYTDIVDKKDGDTWNHLRKPGKYAYTWFLTGVTGPDYVDRGNPGLDASDWGYWVNFSYGKWVDAYSWRNPSEGFHQDLDASYQSCSLGQKELYYLNSITTRTHTALFEKAFRADGKGAAPLQSASQREYWKEEYDPSYYKTISNNYTSNQLSYINLFFPSLQLRLNRVLLFNNKDLPAQGSAIYNAGSEYNLTDTPTASGPDQVVNLFGRAHHGEYVIDKADITALGADVLAKAIRIISLQHDYKLCPGTTSSYGNEQNPYDATNLTGKLTLNAINFGGVGGASLLPPTRFYYDIPQTGAEQVQANVPVNFVGTVDLTANSKFQPGDILKLTASSGAVYYATLLNQVSGTTGNTYTIRYLKTSSPLTAGSYQAVPTKNPPYLKDNTDKWGMFKSDFEADFTGTAETGIARQTTDISSKSLDAWSLRRIATPLGADVLINYEGDEYQNPVLYQPSILSIIYGGPISNDEAKDYIGHLKLPNYTYAQASILFKKDQILTLDAITGFSGLILQGSGTISQYSNSDFGYKRNIKLKILDIEQETHTSGTYGFGMNLLGVGAYLKVQASTNDVFCLKKDNKNNDTPYGVFTGYISAIEEATAKPRYGGGIRVASVTVANGQLQHKTMYAYNHSGVTSFEPLSYYNVRNSQYKALSDGGIDQATTLYRKTYLDKLSKLLVIAREVVPPGVMYERVTVSEAVADGSTVFSKMGSVDYQFAVFNQGMIGVVGSAYQNNSNNFPPGNNSVEFRTRQMAIKDLTSQLGNLKRVTHYDAQGKVLTETVNHYVGDATPLEPPITGDPDSPEPTGYIAQVANRYEQKLVPYSYQGLIKESFGDYREVRRLDGNYDIKANISQRETYPNIQLGATTTDYRTGIQTTTQTLGFDFYSGAATSTLATDGYGNRWVTKTVPAYRWYLAMGPTGSPAANGSSSNRNRNMLSQTAATYVYKADGNNNLVKLRSADVQTWSDAVAVVGEDPNQLNTVAQPGVWRPQTTYTWLPTTSSVDGLTVLSDFVDFPLLPRYPSAPWKKSSEVTRYNVFSNALEAKDINGKYIVTKTGFNHSKVLANGGPARYEELTYSGAEEESDEHPADYFSGGVALTWAPDNTLPNGGGPWGSGGVRRSTVAAHTGQASLEIEPYKHGFSYSVNASTTDPSKFALDPSKPYRLSVWASDPSAYPYYWLDGTYSPASAVVVRRRSSDDWYLLELTIPPIGTGHTTLRIGCYNPLDNSKLIPGQFPPQKTTSIYFDDLRFQPVNAQATSYVYERRTGKVTDILDNDNLSTHYDYDEAGNLRRVLRETLQYGAKEVAEHEYAYASIKPLDMISLLMPPTANTNSATLILPSSLLNKCTISYTIGGTGSSQMPITTTPTISWPSLGSGTYWLKIRVTDQSTPALSREFAQKLVIP